MQGQVQRKCTKVGREMGVQLTHWQATSSPTDMKGLRILIIIEPTALICSETGVEGIFDLQWRVGCVKMQELFVTGVHRANG